MLESAQEIVGALAVQRRKWMEKLQEIFSRINSIPGHAMLCAAGVCYLARSPPDKHKDLLDNWMGYCTGAVPLGSFSVDKKVHSATRSALKLILCSHF